MSVAAQLSLAWSGFVPVTPVHARLIVRAELTGLRPSLACAERLLWARDRRLSELLSQVHAGLAPRALYESVVRNNPEMVAQLERDYLRAADWERRRYGNIKAEFTRRLEVAS